MDDSVTIREADTGDLAAIVRCIVNEAREAEGRSLSIDTVRAGIGAALRDPAIARYWVLVDARGAILGCTSVTREWSDWNAGYYWWVQSMYIDPAHRGQGYLSRLVDAVRAAAQKEHCLELRLYVHEGNAAAVRAYEKTGFGSSAYRIMSRSI